MSKNILNHVSNFIKTNNNYSDLNIVDNLLLNLNFTKYRFNNNKQFGGNIIQNTNDIKNNIINELESSGIPRNDAIKVVDEASKETSVNSNNEQLINNSQILGNDSQFVENNIVNELENTERGSYGFGSTDIN